MTSALDSVTLSYNARDVILYALGIGCSSSHQEDMQYLYEDHQQFGTFPTYILVLPFKGVSSDIVPFPGPTLGIIPEWLQALASPDRILHYDQQLTVHRPLDPDGGDVTAQSGIVAVKVIVGSSRKKSTKRKSTLIHTKTTFTDNQGRILAVGTQGTYLKGVEIPEDLLRQHGINFSDDPSAKVAAKKLKSAVARPPDAKVHMQTNVDQALLYRLSGDYNPLHADPEVAVALGMKQPILHGLCSLAIATRGLIRHVNAMYSKGVMARRRANLTEDSLTGVDDSCPACPYRLRSVGARFNRPVYPGDTLEVRIWNESKNVDCQQIVSAGRIENHTAEKHNVKRSIRLMFEVWIMSSGYGDDEEGGGGGGDGGGGGGTAVMLDGAATFCMESVPQSRL